MPFKTVEISSATCESKALITVDNQSVKLPKSGFSVKFKNLLDGGEAAYIEFFHIDDKGGSAIGEFCNGMTDTKLEVLKGVPKVCVPGAGLSGPYAYSVEAANHHELDPVLIIEPHVFQPQLSLQPVDAPLPPFDPFAAGATLLIGVALGILFGRVIK